MMEQHKKKSTIEQSFLKLEIHKVEAKIHEAKAQSEMRLKEAEEPPIRQPSLKQNYLIKKFDNIITARHIEEQKS
jgi:hypothetical protein